MIKRLTAILAAFLFLTSQVVADWLINPYRFAAAPNPSVTFIACNELNTNLTTYSHTSVSIGAAAPARTVIVATIAEDGAADFSTSSLTIDSGGGAVSAAEQADTAATAEFEQVSIYSLAVPTGTTATIAPTYSEPIQASTVCVWSALNLTSATKTDFAINNGVDPMPVNTDILANGIAVGACGNVSLSGFVWTGLTERADTAGTEHHWSAADTVKATAQTPLTISCNGGGTQGSVAVAAFR